MLKSDEGIFQDLDWPVKSRKDWERIRETIRPGWHNISAGSQEMLPAENRNFPVRIGLPGFFGQMREWLGFKKTCTIFYDDPELAEEMLGFYGNYLLAQCALVLKHFRPEFVMLSEDMAYNNGPMISPEMAEKFMVPQYAKLIAFLNSKGVDIVGIDSDGFVDELIPVFYKAGVNLWGPFEIICRKGKDSLVALAKKIFMAQAEWRDRIRWLLQKERKP